MEEFKMSKYKPVLCICLLKESYTCKEVEKILNLAYDAGIKNKGLCIDKL